MLSTCGTQGCVAAFVGSVRGQHSRWHTFGLKVEERALAVRHAIRKGSLVALAVGVHHDAHAMLHAIEVVADVHVARDELILAGAVDEAVLEVALVHVAVGELQSTAAVLASVQERAFVNVCRRRRRVCVVCSE